MGRNLADFAADFFQRIRAPTVSAKRGCGKGSIMEGVFTLVNIKNNFIFTAGFGDINGLKIQIFVNFLTLQKMRLFCVKKDIPPSVLKIMVVSILIFWTSRINFE